MKKILLSITTVFILSSAVAQKSSSDLNRAIRPVPGPPPTIKLGDIKSFELANGLKVFVVENDKNPTVAYSIALNIHPALEGEAAGTAAITSDLITSGTKNRTKDQLDNDIDFIGARLSATTSGIYAFALSKQNKKLIELLSDVILNADFKQEELDKLKKQTLSQLAQEKDNPDAISKNVQAVLNFGADHPYGELTTEETVDKITLEKCNNYFKTYFRPNVAYLAVVGDVKFSEIKSLVEKYLGSWQRNDVPDFIPAMPKAPEKTRVAFVNKPGAVQSVINITYPVDLKPNSDDVIKSRVMNTILGAGFSSRLFMNLREKHGYTYGSYSSLNNDELVGEFSAYAKVRNAVTDSAVSEILSELKRIRNEKVPADELETIKNYISGNFAISLEDPATVARFAINTERYHLPKDYYNNYLKNLAAISADDVFATAQKYIRPDNATILVVGNEEEVAKKLDVFSPDKKIFYYDTYGKPRKSVIKPAPAGVSTKSIIKSYINALGGSRKINSVKNITIKRSADSQYGKITMVEQKKAPNKYAMTINIGEMTVQKMIYDGSKGSQSGMQGKKEVTGDELKELKVEAINTHEMYYDKLGFKLALKGVEEIDGSDAYVVEVTSPAGKKSTEWYDIASGLKVQSSQTTVTEQGSITQTIDYTDYKEINGIKYPTFINITGGPLPLKLELTSVEVNKGIDDANFKVDL
jgi:predicted Zn-dependent peptidase